MGPEHCAAPWLLGDTVEPPLLAHKGLLHRNIESAAKQPFKRPGQISVPAHTCHVFMGDAERRRCRAVLKPFGTNPENTAGRLDGHVT